VDGNPLADKVPLAMSEPAMHPPRPFRAWLLAIAAGIVAGTSASAAVAAIGIPRRWTWWYDSPNDLGIACAAVLAACAGLGLPPRITDRTWRLGLGLAIAGLAAAACIGLIGSCSRTGILAAGLAIAGLALLLPAAARRLPLAILIALAVGLALVPKAGDRISALAQPERDGSLQCRLQAGRAALAMIADQPGGCGAGSFRMLSDRWYMPVFRGTVITHPFNDTLYIAAEDGLAWAAVLLLAVCGLLGGLIQRGRNGDAWALAATGTVAVLILGSLATTTLRPGGPRWWALACLVLAGVALVRPPLSPPRIRLGILLGLAAALLTVCGIWIAGSWSATVMPIRPDPLAAWPTAAPRHAPVRGSVTVLRDPQDKADEICRQMLRHLAENGFRASTCTVAEYQAGGAAADGIVLVVRGLEKAALAALASCGQPPRGLVLLDPESLPTATACPTLVICGQLNPLARTAADVAGITIREAPVPFCWPRHFPKFADPILAWAATLAPVQPPPSRTSGAP
jgi:hypothetical protein